MFSDHFALDPDVLFLNHGSFGACPRVVLEEQLRWRSQLESEPLRFFLREYQEALDLARSVLAEFLGARAENLVFVSNATEGVNSVLRSLTLEPGDELLTTDQIYNACRNALDFVAARSEARVVVADLPLPISSEGEVVERVLNALTPKTRLVLLDHVASATGIVLPIKRLVSEIQDRGIDVLVDGAHAPGMIALNLDRLGAAYYTGNAHKWICAPKGAAFLVARPDRQEGLRPTTISHGANAPLEAKSRFQLEFDWPGTRDPSAWLSIPAALKFMGGLVDGSWKGLREQNRRLVLEGRQILESHCGLEAVSPPEMMGSLCSFFLPDASEGPPPGGAFAIDPIQQALWHDHRIEVPVMPFPAPPKRLLRISAQIYNDGEDYQRLAEAIRPLLSR